MYHSYYAHLKAALMFSYFRPVEMKADPGSLRLPHNQPKVLGAATNPDVSTSKTGKNQQFMGVRGGPGGGWVG